MNHLVHTGKYLFALIFCIMLFAGCEEDFVLQRGDFKPKVVVNAAFTEGKPWKVSLSFSRDILDNQSRIKPITNAEVYVIRKVNGLQIPLRHEGDGLYTSYVYMPELDRTYELVVNVPGYPTVRARSSSPTRSEVVNVFKEEVNLPEGVKTVVNFEIRDNTRNFYVWNLVTSTSSNPLDTIYTGDAGKLVGSIKKHASLQTVLNSSVLLSNEAEAQGGYFSTTTVDDTQSSNTENQGGSSSVDNKKYLRVMTLSPDLYSYYKSVERFLRNEPVQSSAAPVHQVFSNVQNGLGIFAGYTEKYIEIK
jgi:hypothetical protein